MKYGGAIVLVVLVALVLGVFVLLAWKIEGEQDFRRACAEAGGLAIVNTDDYGDVCVRELIEIGP